MLIIGSINGQRQEDNEIALDIGSIAAAGERCIDKVVMVEETEYDDVVTCQHSYSEKCHTTYTTDFEPQQEEECEENFVKDCYIEYKKVASQEKVTGNFVILPSCSKVTAPRNAKQFMNPHVLPDTKNMM